MKQIAVTNEEFQMDSRESLDRVLTMMSGENAAHRSMGKPYDEALRILNLAIHSHSPQFLYKYFNEENADRSIDDLRKGRLYLASPEFFDDDYDVRPKGCVSRLRKRTWHQRMISFDSFIPMHMMRLPLYLKIKSNRPVDLIGLKSCISTTRWHIYQSILRDSGMRHDVLV